MKRIWYKIFNRLKLERLKLKFAQWWDDKHPGKYCWADCVSWAFNADRFNPYQIESSKGCEIESREHSHKLCYCGSWADGKCFVLLSKDEQERIRVENEIELLTDELPF